MSGPATLYYNTPTDQRGSYVLERPGRYRVRLTGSLGVVTAFQISFQMENEASQDIADSLFALFKTLRPTPCSIGQIIPVDTPPVPLNVIGKNLQGCLVNFPLTITPPTPPTACSIGAVVPIGNPLYFLVLTPITAWLSL